MRSGLPKRGFPLRLRDGNKNISCYLQYVFRYKQFKPKSGQCTSLEEKKTRWKNIKKYSSADSMEIPCIFRIALTMHQRQVKKNKK